MAWCVAAVFVAAGAVASVVAFGLPVDGSFAGAGKSADAASITIVNDAHDPQDFVFAATGNGLDDFVLEDDNDAARPRTRHSPA